jgi:four helix bundle protein
MTIKSYRDLTIWQDAIELAVRLYKVTASFPREERYGLSAQIRRSSSSVAANIAEGNGREHTRSFAQFLRIAQGSLKETETHVILAERVGILAADAAREVYERSESLGKRIRTLIRTLEAKTERQL